MTPLENKAYHVANQLHGNVKFGKSSTMIAQLQKTAELLRKNTELSGEDRNILLAAAYLNKCHELKRIDAENGQKPMSLAEVEKMFGVKVAEVVGELMTEPDEPEHLTKMQQWGIKAEWAAGLSVQAQQILLAEKIINYQQTRDDPTPKWSVERHKEYLASRQLMVDAVKGASPKLYALACQTKDEAMETLNRRAECEKIASAQNIPTHTGGRDGR